MGEIENSLIEAMQIISNNTTQKSKATKTIECQIISVIDKNLGIYEVSYLGGTFRAFSSNPKIQYKQDEFVFVLIPDGDFNKQKYIIGSSAPDDSIFEEGSTNQFIEIAPSILLPAPADMKLCSYKVGGNELSQTLSYSPEFIDYFNKYRQYRFKVTIQAGLIEQAKGYYGLKLILPLITETKQKVNKEVEFNISNIVGNPYNLPTPAKQQLEFLIDEQYQLDTESKIKITAYSKNFKEDSTITIEDIIFSAFELCPIQELKESEIKGYHLYLTASSGEIFLPSNPTEVKTITPTLLLNGVEKTVDKMDCFWFVEDPTVDYESTDYSPYAGSGWRCLNDKITFEDGSFSWSTDKYIYTIPYEKVINSLKIKCAVLCNKRVVTGVIQLRQLSPKYSLSLSSSSGTTIFVKDTGVVSLDAVLMGQKLKPDQQVKFIWNRYDKDDQKVTLPAAVTKTFDNALKGENITFSAALIEGLNMVYCTAYLNEQIIQTCSLLLSVSDNFQYRVSIQNNNMLFKYDANGNSPNSPNYAGGPTLNEFLPFDYKIYNANGTELTAEEYKFCEHTWKIPTTSLIKPKDMSMAQEVDGYYYIQTKELPYVLDARYKAKANNALELQVSYKGNIFIEPVSVNFIKDGNTGTNGTSYAAIIKPKNSDRIVYMKKDLIAVPSLKERQYELQIYNDGRLLKDNEEKISVKWEWFDPKVTFSTQTPPTIAKEINGQSTITLTLPDIDTSKELPSLILQATVSIRDKGASGNIFNQTVLYAHLPLNYVITTKDKCDNNIINGFSAVTYGADGTSPQYDSSTNFALAQPEEKGAWSVIGNLTLKNDVIKPEMTFVEGKSKNLVIFTTEAGDIYVNSILLLFNRYSLANLNGWDGNKIYLDKTNEEYLLAPQIGAGKKNDDNSFTGILMGTRRKNGLASNDIGLFGYGQGKQTMFLDADTGKLTLGIEAETDGQIILDPVSGKSRIAGWQMTPTSFYKKDLAKKREVRLESNPNSDIAFIAKEDSKRTEIRYDGSFFANEGTVGGWKIGPTKLSSGGINIDSSDNKISGSGWEIGSNTASFTNGNFGGLTTTSGGGTGISLSSGFSVTDSAETQFGSCVAGTTVVGNLQADNADIKGRVTAAEGNIGTLSTNYLTVTEKLSAVEGEIKTLNTNYLTVTQQLKVQGEAIMEKATITDLDAVAGRVGTLESDMITTENLESKLGSIEILKVNAVGNGNVSLLRTGVTMLSSCSLSIGHAVLTETSLNNLYTASSNATSEISKLKIVVKGLELRLKSLENK